MTRTLVLLAFVLPATAANAEDWPMWRGPRLDGSSLEKNLPLRWSAGKDTMSNIAWRTPIDGIGYSSPIVWGERVFVTTCLVKEGKRVLVCLERGTGKIVWQREVCASPLEPIHKRNSRASSTPATDGKYVFTSFLRLRAKADNDAPPSKPREKSPIAPELVPEIVISASDFDGNKAWEKTPGRFYSRHGFCSSPILYKDKVIVNADQDAEAYIVALDRATGAEKWRIDRPNRFRSYCVPLIVEAGGKTQMVLAGAKDVNSYDPDTGKPIWIIHGPTEQYVASLVYGDGLFFLTAGFPDYHNLAIRPDGTGDITRSHIVWHEKKTLATKASYVPSPLAAGKFFYMISDTGWLSCFEARRGQRAFMERLGTFHSASPVLADGHVYLTDEDGVTHVLSADGKFNVVSRNPLGERCSCSPAIASGQIFLRTWEHLYCIGTK